MNENTSFVTVFLSFFITLLLISLMFFENTQKKRDRVFDAIKNGYAEQSLIYEILETGEDSEKKIMKIQAILNKQ